MNVVWILGVLMIAAPFLFVMTMMVRTGGWGMLLFVVGFTLVTVALVAGGLYLIGAS